MAGVPRARAGGVLLCLDDVSFHNNDFDAAAVVATLVDEEQRCYDAYVSALRNVESRDACGASASDVLQSRCATRERASVCDAVANEARGDSDEWERHYARSTCHFPLKNYIAHAFPVLRALLKRGDGRPPATVLECGCGTGSTLLPLMHACTPGEARFIGFDVSSTALQHFAASSVAQAHASAGMLHLFRYGEAWGRVDAPHCGGLREALAEHGLADVSHHGCDAVLFVFVLSALPSIDSMLAALRDVRCVLAPQGVVLLRDFALPDHNFFRYVRRRGGASSHAAGLHFRKPDGTSQMFFDTAFVLWLFARAGFTPCTDAALAPALHCNLLTNRKTGVQMRKVFVNGGFVAASTATTLQQQ